MDVERFTVLANGKDPGIFFDRPTPLVLRPV